MNDQPDALEPYLVKIDAGRCEQLTTRRALDARLIDAMSEEQLRGALEITRAYEIVAGGQGPRISRYSDQRSPGRPDQEPSERHIRWHKIIRAWQSACVQQDALFTVAVDILCMGMSCRQVDKAQRRASGWGRKQLGRALDTYCEVRGWTLPN